MNRFPLLKLERIWESSKAKMKEFELNCKYYDNFIQGWYLPEDLTQKMLESVQQLSDKDKMIQHNFPQNYKVTDLKSLDSTIVNTFLSAINIMIKKYLDTYFKIYNLNDSFNLKLNNKINLQHWSPNSNFSLPHCEIDYNNVSRNIVFFTYLNTIKHGGETEFLFQNIKVPPKKGLTLFWPTNWTHVHRGSECNVDKFATTGWFEITYDYRQHYFNIPYQNELNKHSQGYY